LICGSDKLSPEKVSDCEAKSPTQIATLAATSTHTTTPSAGGPLVFVPDQGGQVYLVLSQQNAKPLPEDVLDRIGVPVIVVNARMFDANGIHALALEGLAP
jgi:hypothetical protein